MWKQLLQSKDAELLVSHVSKRLLAFSTWKIIQNVAQNPVYTSLVCMHFVN